ncbi:MAG: mevalonate kinase [Woeseiaceae bacterium]
MAVNRRARAKAGTADAGIPSIRTSGLVEGEWTGGETLPDSHDLLRHVCRSMGVEGRFDIELDTREFADPVSGAKLGLGSSAALTVALVTALCTLAGRPGDAEAEAFEAHRLFQHGHGSGIDIATSFNGGVIEYRISEPSRSLQWPAGLEYAVLWSGRPASTREKIEKLDQARRKEGAAAGTAPLCDASEAVVDAWRSAGVAELLAAFRHYVDALVHFDVDHTLGIFDAGHRELAGAAEKRNLVYKPCGAGGGDTGMVFAADRQAVASFASFAAESGFQLLDASLEAQGVLLES